MVEIDSRIAGLVSVTGAPGALYRLTRVGWKNEQEAGGLHHVFIDVVDAAGERLAGEKVTLTWPGGLTVGVVEEKRGEPFGANFPLNAPLGSYSVFAGTDPAASDRIHGLGLGTPEHPNTLIHTAFELTFEKLETPAPEPEPEPEPDPEPPPEPEPDPDVAAARELVEKALAILAEVEEGLAEAQTLLDGALGLLGG